MSLEKIKLAFWGIVLGLLFSQCLVRFTHAQTYSITGLTTQEVQIIGAGLDKLPRETTDQNQLYARIQAQITQQVQAAAKAKADADRATLDKAVADALKSKETQELQP